MVLKYVDLHYGFSYSAPYQYTALLLTSMMSTVKKEGIDNCLIGISCAGWLVGNNFTNNSLNGHFLLFIPVKYRPDLFNYTYFAYIINR